MTKSENDTVKPYALIGHDNYLFLAGDSNDSLGQFTGSVILSEGSIKAWSKHFANIDGWEIKYGFRAALLISPAKEFIFPDYFPEPHKRGQTTPIDSFIEAMADKKFVYPIKALTRQRHFAYERTDTHWTDAGAALAASEVVKHWEMTSEEINAIANKFSIKMTIGDLGGKLPPPHPADFVLRFTDSPQKYLIFENKISNNGNIRVYENEAALLAGPCLVLGDSFGFNLAPSLLGLFKRVVYAYTAAVFDAELVDMEKPSHVIFEIAQRFLIGQPESRRSVFQIACEKTITMSEDRRTELISYLNDQKDGKCGKIADRMLRELEKMPAGVENDLSLHRLADAPPTGH